MAKTQNIISKQESQEIPLIIQKTIRRTKIIIFLSLLEPFLIFFILVILKTYWLV